MGRAGDGFTDIFDMWAEMSGVTVLSDTNSFVLATPEGSSGTLITTPLPPGIALILAAFGALGVLGRRRAA